MIFAYLFIAVLASVLVFQLGWAVVEVFGLLSSPANIRRQQQKAQQALKETHEKGNR